MQRQSMNINTYFYVLIIFGCLNLRNYFHVFLVKVVQSNIDKNLGSKREIAFTKIVVYHEVSCDWNILFHSLRDLIYSISFAAYI